MPTKPYKATKTNTSMEVVNSIINSSTLKQNGVPVLTENATVDDLRAIGNIITSNAQLQNTFIDVLINRIALVRITSKLFYNPMEMFKKGYLELGETVENVFIELCKVENYNPDDAEETAFKQYIPDVRSEFFITNFKKFYPQTVRREELRGAFLSWGAMEDFITNLIERMYTSAYYDEFLVTKYILALRIFRGQIASVVIPPVETANKETIATEVKATSNAMTLMNNRYNLASVRTHTDKNDQFLIMSSRFDAFFDVNVLASAFNMDKVEFLGHRLMIDGFGALDIERLGELFANDPSYYEFSQEELDALNEIPCVLVDREFFQIYDELSEIRDLENPKGLYWNYFYHVWRTFATSIFAQAVLFNPTTPTVTQVAINPSALTLGVDASAQLTAEVTATNYAPQTVEWTSDNEYVKVSRTGYVTVLQGANGTATITATSTYNTEVTGQATITIG